MRDSSAAVRIDDYSQLHGEIAVAVRGAGARSTVGVPIVVAGRLWGAMAGWTRGRAGLEPATNGLLVAICERTWRSLSFLARQQIAFPGLSRETGGSGICGTAGSGGGCGTGEL